LALALDRGAFIAGAAASVTKGSEESGDDEEEQVVTEESLAAYAGKETFDLLLGGEKIGFGADGDGVFGALGAPWAGGADVRAFSADGFAAPTAT